jgi:hypothetical protein
MRSLPHCLLPVASSVFFLLCAFVIGRGGFRFDQAAFDRIEIGMPIEQVSEILGEKHVYIEELSDDDAVERRTSYWQDDWRKLQITIESDQHGRVTSKSVTSEPTMPTLRREKGDNSRLLHWIGLAPTE